MKALSSCVAEPRCRALSSQPSFCREAQWPFPVKMAGGTQHQTALRLRKIFQSGLASSGSFPAALGDNLRTVGQCDIFSNDKVNLDTPVARYFRDNSLPVRACFCHFFLKHKEGNFTVFSFLEGGQGLTATFTSWTNKWSVHFGQPILFLVMFSPFFFSIFFFCVCFSPVIQALQCMLISLQAELDIQRYLMKIESSQRVSTPPFLSLHWVAPCLLPFYPLRVAF